MGHLGRVRIFSVNRISNALLQLWREIVGGEKSKKVWLLRRSSMIGPLLFYKKIRHERLVEQEANILRLCPAAWPIFVEFTSGNTLHILIE